MPENKPLEIADKVIRTAIFDVATKAAIKAAQAEMPFLALPIISSFFTFFVNRLANFFYENLETIVAFKIIDLQVNAEIVAYKKAVEKQGENTDAAREEFKKALSNLIRYRGH